MAVTFRSDAGLMLLAVLAWVVDHGIPALTGFVGGLLGGYVYRHWQLRRRE